MILSNISTGVRTPGIWWAAQVTDLFTHGSTSFICSLEGIFHPLQLLSEGFTATRTMGARRPIQSTFNSEYPGAHEFTATFEATLVPSIKGEAIEMCGTEGRLWIDRSRYEYYPTGAKEPAEVVRARQLPGTRDSLTQEHVNNFVECLKTRTRPNGDVLIGHRSAQASRSWKHLVRAETAHRFRYGTGTDLAFLAVRTLDHKPR